LTFWIYYKSFALTQRTYYHTIFFWIKSFIHMNFISIFKSPPI
jgi:hypothetical protein